jgi:hypothetical protein
MGHWHEHDHGEHDHGREEFRGYRGSSRHGGRGHSGRRGFGPWAYGYGYGFGPGAAFGPGFGPWAFRGRPSREEWVRRLEEYQKDLEQEAADVADLIRRLRADGPEEPDEQERPTETASA